MSRFCIFTASSFSQRRESRSRYYSICHFDRREKSLQSRIFMEVGE